jgi:hypothetical protein
LRATRLLAANLNVDGNRSSRMPTGTPWWLAAAELPGRCRVPGR